MAIVQVFDSRKTAPKTGKTCHRLLTGESHPKVPKVVDWRLYGWMGRAIDCMCVVVARVLEYIHPRHACKVMLLWYVTSVSVRWCSVIYLVRKVLKHTLGRRPRPAQSRLTNGDAFRMWVAETNACTCCQTVWSSHKCAFCCCCELNTSTSSSTPESTQARRRNE